MLNTKNMQSEPFLCGDYYERLPDFSPDEKHIISVRDVFADTARASINVVSNFFEVIRHQSAGD